jgi:hypothetical protein
VVSNTNDPVTIVDYIVEPLVTDCTSAPVCFTVRATNNDTIEQNVDYIDCNGIAQTTPNIPPNGGSVDFCAREITAGAFATQITQLSCGCTL